MILFYRTQNLQPGYKQKVKAEIKVEERPASYGKHYCYKFGADSMLDAHSRTILCGYKRRVACLCLPHRDDIYIP